MPDTPETPQTREQVLRTIEDARRAARPRSSRGLWIAALVVGLGCGAAFTYALVAGTDGGSHAPGQGSAPSGSSGSSGSSASAPPTGPGFSLGLALGLVAGLAIGGTIARQRSPAEPSADHSSRS